MTAANDAAGTAVAFGRALVTRDFAAAYAMTSRDYQRRATLEQMRAAFEAIVPADWGAGARVDVVHTMDDWPGRQSTDAGWVYVSIGGDVYSEGVTVVVTAENGSLKVRDAEFGRP